MKIVTPKAAKPTYEEEQEQKQYQLKYQQQLSSYTEKIETYNNNRERAYGLLWNRCNKAMQSKLENRSEFESKIKGNPIELLKAIKEHAMRFQETKWYILTIIDAMKAFINMKQKDDESLIDYRKRFKTARDVFMSHIGGPLFLNKVVERHTDYIKIEDLIQMEDVSKEEYKETLDANEKVTKLVFHEFCSGLYLDNCDRLKYGEFSSNLYSQYGLGNDQYPKTLTNAHQALATVKISQAYWDKQRSKRRNRGSSQGNNNDDQTRPAKVIDAGDSDTVSEMTYVQFKRQRYCYVCGDKACSAKTCPQRPHKKYEDWHINKCDQVREAQHLLKTVLDDVTAALGEELSSDERSWFPNCMHVFAIAVLRISLIRGDTYL